MTKNYHILLVDDEYLALDLLDNFLATEPNVQLVDKIQSPLKALELLKNQRVDILFLDVQMPSLSGVDLLKQLTDPPATVFTTAYRDYAVDAFDLSAVDYLLKPFSLERFQEALTKAKRACLPAHTIEAIPPSPQRDHFTVKVDGKLVRINYAEVCYVEGLKEYVRIVTSSARYITYERLGRMEELLPAQDFLRVHKSYLVAKREVRALEGNLLEVGLQRIPVSRSRRELVLRELFE